MDSSEADMDYVIQAVTVENVNRLLEVGRLLLSVLTQEEIETIQKLLSEARPEIN